MQIYDVKFDNGEGDASASLDAGVIVIKLTEANPNFPSGAQINIPLDALFKAIKLKANSTLVSWALSGMEALLDAIP